MDTVTIDGVDYKFDELTALGQHCVKQLNQLVQERSQIETRLEHIRIIEAAYVDNLKRTLEQSSEEVPAEQE